MGVKLTVLAYGQPPTLAFTVLALLCGPKTNGMGMGAVLFTKNGEGRNSDFDFLISHYVMYSVILFRISTITIYLKNLCF